MPVECELSGGILLVRTIGRYSNEELKRALDAAAALPERRPGTSILFDGTKSEAPLSPADIDWRTRWLATLPGLGFSPRMAAAVRGDEAFRYGLGRQLSIRLEGQGLEIRLFADVGSARSWLAGEGDDETGAPPP